MSHMHPLHSAGKGKMVKKIKLTTNSFPLQILCIPTLLHHSGCLSLYLNNYSSLFIPYFKIRGLKKKKITHELHLPSFWLLFCLVVVDSRQQDTGVFVLEGVCKLEGWVFLVFILLGVVKAGKVILYHNDRVSFSLLALRLLFLKQNSPQKCNIGTCNWTTEPQAVNSPPTNKLLHCQTLEGIKRCLLFCLACMSHKLPFFSFLSLFATVFASLPSCQWSVKWTGQHYFSRKTKRYDSTLLDECCVSTLSTGSELHKSCAGKTGTANTDWQKPFDKSHLTKHRSQRRKRRAFPTIISFPKSLLPRYPDRGKGNRLPVNNYFSSKRQKPNCVAFCPRV